MAHLICGAGSYDVLDASILYRRGNGMDRSETGNRDRRRDSQAQGSKGPT